MGCFIIVRALIVRFLFTFHGIFGIWRLYYVTSEWRFWFLTLALIGLAFETAITLHLKKGQEWKWFCPSVFFYLLCLVPTVWFLELHELELRIAARDANTTRNNSTDNDTTTAIMTTKSLQSNIDDEDYYESHDVPAQEPKAKAQSLFSEQIEANMLKFVEQFLLLILIIGRWLLPKGKLTHDQLSQLLLVYIGTAADIVEFFEAFKEGPVKHSRVLCTVILAIWSWSILQFTMVFTATKARKDHPGALALTPIEPLAPSENCCTPDVFGIVMSIFMQDGPFLVLRLILIIKFSVFSYTNVFFTCKNTLVCVLLLYRFVVIQLQRYHLIKQNQEGETIKVKESSTNSQFILRCASTDQYYKYSTKVFLKESLLDCNDVDITYVVKRHMSLPAESMLGDDSIDDIRTLYASEAGVLLPGEIDPITAELLEHPAMRSRADTMCGDPDTSVVSYTATSRELVAAVRRASLIASAQGSDTAFEMERQMVGSQIFSLETGSEASLDRAMNIIKVKRMRKKGITLSNALTKSINAMHSALGLNMKEPKGLKLNSSKNTLSLSAQNVG